jgi:two-component system response regulator YesN
MKTRKIAIIEDNEVYRNLISDVIINDFKNIVVEQFSTGEKFLEEVSKYGYEPNVVISDYDLSGPFNGRAFMTGLEILKTTKEQLPDSEFIMLSAHENKEFIKGALSGGAYDYVIKDDSAIDNIINRVKNTLRIVDSAKEVKELNRLKIMLIGILAGGIALAWFTA